MEKYKDYIIEKYMGEILKATAQDVDFQYNDPLGSELPSGILKTMQLEAMGAWMDSREAMYVMQNVFVFLCVDLNNFIYKIYSIFLGITILLQCKCNENVFKLSLVE